MSRDRSERQTAFRRNSDLRKANVCIEFGCLVGSCATSLSDDLSARLSLPFFLQPHFETHSSTRVLVKRATLPEYVVQLV